MELKSVKPKEGKPFIKKTTSSVCVARRFLF